MRCTRTKGSKPALDGHARADGGLDEELIIRMKNNGLTALKFGIESIDKEVLKEINKKLDIKKV